MYLFWWFLMLLPDLENHLSLYLSVHVPRLLYLKHAKSSKSPFLTFILILQNLTKLLQNLPMMFFAILLFNYQAANSEHHVRWIPPNPPKFLEIEPQKSTNHQKTKPFQVGHHIPLISLWYTMIYHIYIFTPWDLPWNLPLRPGSAPRCRRSRAL